MKILLITQICCVLLGISYDLSGRDWLFSGCIGSRLKSLQVPNFNSFQVDQSTRPRPPYTFPKFDEYGDLRFAQEKERLDYFAEELRSVPGEPGYIIEYRRKGQRQRRLSRAKRAKDYLVKDKKIDARRILIVDGGYQKEFKIELRLGPVSQK